MKPRLRLGDAQGTAAAPVAAWAQARVGGPGLLPATTCLWEQSTASVGAAAGWDMQKLGCVVTSIH